MRYLLFTFLIVLVLSSTTFSQTRQQAFDNLSKLKDEAIRLEKIILSVDKEDIDLSVKENANVFRILPRDVVWKSEYGELYSIRGGGVIILSLKILIITIKYRKLHWNAIIYMSALLALIMVL